MYYFIGDKLSEIINDKYQIINIDLANNVCQIDMNSNIQQAKKYNILIAGKKIEKHVSNIKFLKT